MKTFILDADHNITVYASQREAAGAVPAGDAFTTAAGLKAALKNYSPATAVGIWNSLTGVTPVRKFKDAATAAQRIFTEVQKLGGPDSVATEAPIATPTTKRTPATQSKPVKAANKAGAAKKIPSAAKTAPRENSKNAQLIEMLRTKDGATLEAICGKFGWQPHTTRALMSAGGSLTKKYGITVISEKPGDTRSYRIAK
jgi:transposase